MKMKIVENSFPMKTIRCLVLFICFFTSQHSTTTTLATATDENISIQRYVPIPSDTFDSVNKRFENLMESGGSSSISGSSGSTGTVTASGARLVGALPPNWAKVNAEKVDVKAELMKLNYTYDYEAAWPEVDLHLGAVSAVTFDTDMNVVLFHRVDRIWGPATFNNKNLFTERHLGPIQENTILALDSVTGKIKYSWGKNRFYMPHGLTIDQKNNAWVTDVALHQVFKFGPKGSDDNPLITLGTAFTPGSVKTKFCKPTSVAVLENGDFFVADGYCNARILKFNKNGEYILHWGQNSFSGTSFEVAPKNFFAIPHALTLVPEKQLVCAADRENGRIQCFHWTNCTFHSQYHSPIIGARLFSMAYSPAEGGEFFVVNGNEDVIGESEHYYEISGFVMNMSNKNVISKFGPHNGQFKNPHDVAVTQDGLNVYVAELDPARIHKFVHKNLTQSSFHLTPSRVLWSTPEESVEETEHSRPGGTAILVSSLMLLFTFVTFGLALFIARRRKRGCLPFGEKNRVHAWDKTESFKLGGLLKDRSKHNGFERLDQDGSDEESQANTTLTTPFA